MFRQLLEHSPLLTYPLVALGMFLFAFILVVVRTFLKKPAEYDAAAALPLADDSVRHGGP